MLSVDLHPSKTDEQIIIIIIISISSSESQNWPAYWMNNQYYSLTEHDV
jgi:hypothetical protein